MATSLGSFIDSLKKAAAEVDVSSSVDVRTLRELFEVAIENSLERVRSESVDSFLFGPWVISDFILLAESEGYSLKDASAFLSEIFD